jgi:hypothetical protein
MVARLRRLPAKDGGTVRRRHRPESDYAGLTKTPPKLPPGPCQRVVDLMGGPPALWQHGTGPRGRHSTWRVYERALARGYFTVVGADIVACSIGVHPAQIWGDAWFEPYLEGAA